MYDEFSVRGEGMVDVFDQTLDLLLCQLVFLSDVMQSDSVLKKPYFTKLKHITYTYKNAVNFRL